MLGARAFSNICPPLAPHPSPRFNYIVHLEIEQKLVVGALATGSVGERLFRCSMAIAYIEIFFSMFIIIIWNCINLPISRYQ